MRNVFSEAMAIRMGLSAREYEASKAALPAEVPPFRLSLMNGFLPFLDIGGVQSNTLQYTFGANYDLERQYTGVKLIIANYGAAQTLAGVCAAPSASRTNVTTPVDATGATISWTQATTAGSTSAALPVGTTAQPSYTLTDLIPIEGIIANDGSGLFPLKTRVVSNASGWSAPTIYPPNFNLVPGNGARRCCQQ